MVTVSVASGTPFGSQLLASPQLLVPAPPSQVFCPSVTVTKPINIASSNAARLAKRFKPPKPLGNTRFAVFPLKCSVCGAKPFIACCFQKRLKPVEPAVAAGAVAELHANHELVRAGAANGR